MKSLETRLLFYSIAVPVGKRIKIDNNVGGWEGKLHFGWHNDADDWRWNNDPDYGMPWEYNVEYVMTNDGLKRVDGKVDNDNTIMNNNDDNIQPDIQDYDRQRQQLEEQREQKRKELQQLDSVLKKEVQTLYHLQHLLHPQKLL